MPMLALIGIGLMYGPIRPETKAMGSKRGDDGESRENRRPADLIDRPGDDLERGSRSRAARWRWMFSTMTIASSTRMPIEKISANNDTRLMVKPQAHEANSVAASVTMTAAPTTSASRRPIESITSSTTEAVAKSSFSISLIALSLAVSP